MLKGKKIVNNDLIYTHFKKHYCPHCMVRLNRVKCSKIVNSKSIESKNYNFQLGDVYMCGDVKFIWTEFQCPKCKHQITVDEMKKIEKQENNSELE